MITEERIADKRIKESDSLFLRVVDANHIKSRNFPGAVGELSDVYMKRGDINSSGSHNDYMGEGLTCFGRRDSVFGAGRTTD